MNPAAIPRKRLNIKRGSRKRVTQEQLSPRLEVADISEEAMPNEQEEPILPNQYKEPILPNQYGEPVMPIMDQQDPSQIQRKVKNEDPIPRSHPWSIRIHTLRLCRFTHPVYVNKSRIHGSGIFSRGIIRKDEIILEYTGDVCSNVHYGFSL